MGRIIPALLVLIVALLYGPALENGFAWDDHDLIEHDARVTGPLDLEALAGPYWPDAPGGAAGAPDAPSAAAGTPRYSRPLVTLSLHAQYRSSSLSPRPYHALNIALHLLAILALYQLLLELTGSMPAAGLGAGLFAVFPTQVEPVAWIAGRTDLLAGALGFTALVCFQRARRLDRWSIAAGLTLAGALLSKEVAWIFPALMVAQPWLLPFARDGASAPRPPATPLELRAPLAWLPIGLAISMAVAARWIALGGGASIDLLGGLPPWALPLRVATSIGRYAAMLAWPWNPSALPAGRTLPPPSSPLLWAGLAVMVAVPALIAWSIRRRKGLVAWGILWIVLGLLPVVNLVPLAAPSPVAERFWYVPLGGAALLVSLALARPGAGSSRARSFAVLLLLAACAWTSAHRVADWSSDRSLWEAEVRRHGLRHPLAARNLGLARLQDGDMRGAEAVWRAALAEGLGGGTAHYFELGLSYCRLLVEQHRLEEARALAARLEPLDPDPVRRGAFARLRGAP
jgi:hypothetical protein